MKNGIRSAAEDLCTRQIGHRTDLDAAEAERREVREKRFTSLDRVILRSARPLAREQYGQIMIPPVTLTDELMLGMEHISGASCRTNWPRTTYALRRFPRI
jgi:hypothetical protein